MNPNPFISLLHSRKFWILILDTVISLTLYFVTKYASPALVEDVKTVILALQVPFSVIIGAIAYEDGTIVQAKSWSDVTSAVSKSPGEGDC